ncbi:MAG: glutaredoxin family protein [Acidobacteria bacterium]|nr:glutaredoxin family protein [Acidobacteriota bacterium]
MPDKVTVYGADWCGDTVRTLRHLDRNNVQYDYIDIEENTDAEQKVIAFNNGKRRIPMVEVGSETLSVPSDHQLSQALKK